MLDSLLDEAGYAVAEMDVLAYGRGPGAFTGVRVATGVTQAIAYGADLPVAQISSLAAIAQGACREKFKQQKKQPVLVASDARMEEVYFAGYENINGFVSLLSQQQIIRPELLIKYLYRQTSFSTAENSCFCVGSGWQVYAKTLQPVLERASDIFLDIWPHARDVATLALKEVENKTLVNAEAVSPVYLRDNVARKSSASS